MKIQTLSSLRWAMVAAALMMTPAVSQAASTVVIKAGMGISEQHYEYKAMQAFKQYVETQSNGKMEVQLFPNAMLGSDLEVLESIKLGTVQMNIPTPSVLGNYVKEFRLADLPYLYPNEQVANRVADSAWAKKLLDMLKPAGFVGVAIGNFGFRNITNNVRPIHTLEDLKGLKIRVMQNPVTLNVFRALGTNPTPMGFGEVFSALQTGTVDGQETPYATIFQSRFNEVQKYLSDSHHQYSWGILVIGKRFFDRLTEEQQAIVMKAGEVFHKYMLEASRISEADAKQTLIDSGMEFTPIAPEARKEMRDAVLPVIAESGHDISPDMFKDLMQTIDTATKAVDQGGAQ